MDRIEQLNIMLIDHEVLCRDNEIDTTPVEESHDNIIKYVKDNFTEKQA